MRIAVTGASGFVGSTVCAVLGEQGHQVVPMGRKGGGRVDVRNPEYWLGGLQGVEAVIHLAARAHIVREDAQDALAAFRSTNVEGTRNMVTGALRAGVRRFVLVSSIGVLGSNSTEREPFSDSTQPAPMEPYAQSKFEAEQVLRQLTEGTETEFVIVRPPLVYGPGVRGNFLRLLRWVAAGAPLPFGAIRAQRSFIGVENLAGLLVNCVTHPRAAGESFVVADGEDIALPDLLRVLSAAMRKPDRIFRFPVSLLKVSASLAGRRLDFEKLTAGLRVDAARARELLQWVPSRPLAEWYERESNNREG